MYKVYLNKYNTIWTHTCVNPVGGSFGSHFRGSKRAALAVTTRDLPAGTQYHLFVNDKDMGVQTKA